MVVTGGSSGWQAPEQLIARSEAIMTKACACKQWQLCVASNSLRERDKMRGYTSEQ